MRLRLPDLKGCLRRWAVPLALFVAVLLSYGIYIPWLGLYGDDWLYIYNYHLLGPNSFWNFVAIDRPFSAWIYVITTPIFGVTAWPYHAFLLLLRWLSAVLLWRLLRLVWPKLDWLITWVALLFAVYPGFQQQPIAVQYILHFSVLDLFLLSLVAMIQAQLNRGKFWLFTAIAWVGELSVFSLEYFVGLELLRPVLLWLALRDSFRDWQSRLKQVVLTWLPYLAITIGFLVWRVWIFKFPTYQPELAANLNSTPLPTLLHLGKRILVDLYKVMIGAWQQTFSLPANSSSRLFFFGLVLGTLALFLFFLDRYEDQPNIPSKKDLQGSESLPDKIRLLEVLLVGLFALFIAGWPFWATGVALELSFPWDRSTLPFMLGACLTTGTLIGLLFPRRVRPFLVGVLFSLAIGLHYQNAWVYKGEWQALQQYFWQLTWRAPQLQPGTIVASDWIPLFRFSDNDLTPLLNWTYAPEQLSTRIPYKYFDLSLRLGSTLPEVKKDLPIKHGYRNLLFTGNSSDMLVVFNQPGGCLWVLRPGDKKFPGLPETVQDTLPLSNLKQIVPDATQPAYPPANLGTEPDHNWCYYFEKADLARQQADWSQVAKLAVEAEKHGLAPIDPSEWLPFIEGYTQGGEFIKARQLTQMTSQKADLQPLLCSIWSRAKKAISRTQDESIISAVLLENHCEP